MDYSFLAQDGATMTVTPSSSGFRGFFRPITRFLFPVPLPGYSVPACIPVGPLPAGTLGRDSNGNLTVNGQTYCNPQPRVVARPYGPIYYP